MTIRPQMAPVRVTAPPRTLAAAAAACLLALTLAACDRAPEMEPTAVNASAADRAALIGLIPGPEGDPSVPDAQAAFAAQAAAPADADAEAAAVNLPQAPASAALAAGPRNPPMTEQQQSTRMPLPGQANDHSVATTPGTADPSS